MLHQLVDALGSPLNALLPDQAAQNVEAFRAVYRAHRMSGDIYFAHKANRYSGLVRRLAASDAGIDVASLGKLQHALGAGFTPGRIMAIGPKNRDFLWLAARVGGDRQRRLTGRVGPTRLHRRGPPPSPGPGHGEVVCLREFRRPRRAMGARSRVRMVISLLDNIN